jgi:hypothetical protein
MSVPLSLHLPFSGKGGRKEGIPCLRPPLAAGRRIENQQKIDNGCAVGYRVLRLPRLILAQESPRKGLENVRHKPRRKTPKQHRIMAREREIERDRERQRKKGLIHSLRVLPA